MTRDTTFGTAQAPPAPDWPIEITRFAKSGGLLTKKIGLDTDGKLVSDASQCLMNRGTAHRASFDNIAAFGAFIHTLGGHEAIALGALRPDLPSSVKVTTKHKLVMKQGGAQPDLIARTGEYILFRPKRPALALLDFDTKGMPAEVGARIAALGGFWPALTSLLPALKNVAHVMRRSTSAGLFRTDTDEAIAGSDGVHAYVLVQDGADGEPFLKVLHERCWLAGLGWMMIGASGQLLERSFVDRVVGSPERLVFEGPPMLVPPLAQDQESRRPVAIEGEALDTVAACPPLTNLEQAKVRELRAKEVTRLAPEAAKARDAFIDRQARELAQRSGIDLRRARRTIARQCEGVLLPNVELPFDDPEFAGSTVADVLANPGRFAAATLADPLEGVKYGRCKARIMRRPDDGTPWIHSFAHGRTTYELKFDFDAAKDALANEPKDSVVDLFVRLVLVCDLDPVETERLRNLVHERTKISLKALNEKLKAVRQQAATASARQEAERRLAERQDPRPQLPVPPSDAEWLPTMQAVNDVLGSNCAAEPPMRNANNSVAMVRGCRVPSLHFLTSKEANDDAGP